MQEEIAAFCRDERLPLLDLLPALRLADPSPSVRAAVARALGRIGSREAIDTLVSAVKSDPVKDVFEETSKALSRIPGS